MLGGGGGSGVPELGKACRRGWNQEGVWREEKQRKSTVVRNRGLLLFNFRCGANNPGKEELISYSSQQNFFPWDSTYRQKRYSLGFSSNHQMGGSTGSLPEEEESPSDPTGGICNKEYHSSQQICPVTEWGVENGNYRKLQISNLVSVTV